MTNSTEMRPLDSVSIHPPEAPASLAAMAATPMFADAEAYFRRYPARSLMSGISRAALHCLIRTRRPRVVAEIGTLHAGTAEVMARALWENGGPGELHTADPFGADRCPAIIGAWPAPLQMRTTYYALNSMSFFADLDHRGIALDLVLIDGNHDFEFALFDLCMAARLIRPGGIIVMDNAEQSGPFRAARMFLADNPAWRELGDAIATSKADAPFNHARASLAGTSFIVLQAPDCLSIGPGPHSSGQRLTKNTRVVELVLDLPAQVTSGTLFYQVVLRAFADGARYVAELKATGSFRLKLTGHPLIVRELIDPLIADVPADLGAAAYTVEVDLSWLGRRRAPPLLLSGLPQCSDVAAEAKNRPARGIRRPWLALATRWWR